MSAPVKEEDNVKAEGSHLSRDVAFHIAANRDLRRSTS